MIPGNTSSQGKYVDPPTSVSASAGNAQATVTFTLPVYDGKGTATYVATASPGGATASGASSPLVVTGLNNGTSYTFTVSTISGYGVSIVSGASSAVTPTAPAPSFAPSFGPSFQSCNGCVPGQYGYYGGDPNDCNSTTGWSYSCDGQLSYKYYQSACCPDYAVCGAYRDGVCGYTTPVTPSFTPSFGPTFGPTFGPDFGPTFGPDFGPTFTPDCAACGGGPGQCFTVKGETGCI